MPRNCVAQLNWRCLLLFLSSLQENIPLEEVFENLRCSREGLSTQQAQQRLEIFGPNKLEEKEVCFHSRHHSALCFFSPTLLEKTHVINNCLKLGFWWPQESKFLKFLGFMWNPLSWVMEAAAIMAIALANGGVGHRNLLQTSNSISKLFSFGIFVHSWNVFWVVVVLWLCMSSGEATRLAGLCWYHNSACHQLNNQFYRGKQCW